MLRRLLIAGFASLLALPQAYAQSAATYPTKTVKLIVGFPPGGGADQVARILSQKLASILGKPVVVENRPGANGRIAADFVVRSAPDGHTILVSPEGAIVIGPHIAQSMSYDPQKDLAAVSLLTKTAAMLVATPKLPVSNLADLIKLAKEKPGTLFYGSSGVGGPNHLAGEVFKLMAGVDIVHAPYKGTGAAIPPVMSGEIPLMFGFVPALASFVQAGSVKALAVGSSTRSASLPDVPTMAEAGVPGYDMNSWIGAFAPAKTPAPIVAKLQAAMVAALTDADTTKTLLREGLEPIGSTPEVFAHFVADEDVKYAALFKQLNIKE
jgi:tripartite-type tricarboxylate transporter receptor subunit TctC